MIGVLIYLIGGVFEFLTGWANWNPIDHSKGDIEEEKDSGKS